MSQLVLIDVRTQAWPAHSVVVTDDIVHALWGSLIALPQIVIPAGEQSKTREMKAYIEDQLLALKSDRCTTLIAVGGGVVTDIAGFVAATLYRGIRWIACPTTLLGMVDAAAGGKVAVNHAAGKNLIGAFYPPDQIWLDSCFLSTLPHREWLSGLGEVIKYALIALPGLLPTLDQGTLDARSIQRCLAWKMDLVRHDPDERQGLRAILNFGHTVGHGLEVLSQYTLTHGHAVVLGMLVEASLSALPCTQLAWLISFVQRCGFTLDVLRHVDGDGLWMAMATDKKGRHGRPQIVVLETLGRAVYQEGRVMLRPIQRADLDRAIAEVVCLS